MEGPKISVSKIPLRRPFCAKARARFTKRRVLVFAIVAEDM